MAAIIPEAFAHLATVMKDGSPQVTPACLTVPQGWLYYG